MKKIAISLVTSLAVSIAAAAHADNLLQVYQQALQNDPTYKQAQATMMSNKQYLPIARSYYFPQLDLGGQYGYGWMNDKLSVFEEHSSNPKNHAQGMGYSYEVKLTQPIINFSTLVGISAANYTAKAAIASFAAAGQDLIQRTTTAYLSVLLAYDTLRTDITYKNQVRRQMVTAEQQYTVGLIAKTGVYDAQSIYDAQVATVIQDKTTLSDQLAALRAITGKNYTYLAGIRVQVPLVKPIPANQKAWMDGAIEQNYQLKSDQFLTQYYKKNIQQEAALRYPTLGAVFDMKGNHDQPVGPDHGNGSGANVALSLDFPVYQGGLISATTKQNRYLYLNKAQVMEATYRSVIQNIRVNYLGVTAGISTIIADKATIKSTENTYQATMASYKVGTRTMTEVLEQLALYAQAKLTYFKDQYTYINSTVALKETAGTLDAKDVEKINSWLTKKINVNPSTATKQIEQKTKTKRMDKKTRKQRAHSTKAPTVSSRSMKASPFSIQLYASKTRTDAKRFVKAMSSRHNVRIVKNGSWYKVLYGSYKNYSDSRAALSTLNPALMKYKPWVYHTR